jgi:meso-butanediol dehydrogenase/(S,S)-butanediol dehydrogenase/diacetyl reductase
MGRLAGKKTIITGGTTGIGEALVHRCVAEGARVAFCARSRDEGARVAEASGAAFHACDVTDADQVARFVAAAADAMGGIDLVVANAGGAVGFSQWPDEGPDEWQRTIDLNLNGTMFTCQSAWPHLERSEAAAIVTISSLSAVMAIGRRQLEKMGGMQPPASYQASKAAIDGLMIHLAGRGGEHGIRVNSIRPGRILTDKLLGLFGGDAEAAIFWSHYEELQILERHGHVDDVANAAVFLGSDESAFITGQILNVDGGAIAHL